MYFRDFIGTSYFEVFDLVVSQEGIGSFIADAQHLAHLIDIHDVWVIAEHNTIRFTAGNWCSSAHIYPPSRFVLS